MQYFLKCSIFCLGVITISVLSLTGCSNTIRGVGQDMQATGAAISGEPQKPKKPVYHTRAPKSVSSMSGSTSSSEVMHQNLNTSIETSPTPPTNMSGIPTGSATTATPTSPGATPVAAPAR